MQNCINVETLPAKIIAENPSLQKNVQEKAVGAILTKNNIVYNVQYLGEFINDNWKCDKWNVTFAGKDRNKQEFEYHTGIGYQQCVKPRPFGWGNYSAVQRKTWVVTQTVERLCRHICRVKKMAQNCARFLIMIC